MINIRNFSIIAHIDHGKSTLADKLIEYCKKDNKKKIEILNNFYIEKERGITIKSHTVSLNYYSKNKINYKLNLIDTPGHTDFSYEVYKSISCCEGALLLIDITKGIQSQTIINYHIAKNKNIKLIPVLSKIDLLNLININKLKKDIVNSFNFKINDIILCSAKKDIGISDILESIVNNIPCPINKYKIPLAIIIDSFFKNFVGIIITVRIYNGVFKAKQKIYLTSSKTFCYIDYVGIFTPERIITENLSSGDVGFIVIKTKNLKLIKINSIIIDDIENIKELNNIFSEINFKKNQLQFYVNFFPLDRNNFNKFNNSIEKLQLNDFSFKYKIINSKILGFGFRIGFLGILHMEIIRERLEREFNIKLIITTPSILYKIIEISGKITIIDDPIKMPNYYLIKEIHEPIGSVYIYTPRIYIGKIIELCFSKRGKLINILYLNDYIIIIFEIPVSEIILNLFNELKTISNGYAYMYYNFKNYLISDIVKVDILINKIIIEPLSFFVHKNNVINESKIILLKIKKNLSKELFNIIIQAKVKNKIILKETIKFLKKNVISKCYGGDKSRKKKLLYKQKRGKKKLQKFNKLIISHNTYCKILKYK